MHGITPARRHGGIHYTIDVLTYYVLKIRFRDCFAFLVKPRWYEYCIQFSYRWPCL